MHEVSVFIVGTCQIRYKPHNDGFDSMQFSKLSPGQTLWNGFQCASSAEFYIKPINSCIDDMDFIKPDAEHLVFTEDFPILPDDFRGLPDTINCLQIMPNLDYPGFVELQRLGKTRFNWHCNQFEFQKTNDRKKITF